MAEIGYRKKLVDYFKKNLKKGYTSDSLIYSLVGQGYSRAVVDMALQQANQELERTTEQLIQSEKLAAIGEFAAGIAHEINNPLTAVSMNTAFLIDGLKDDDKRLKQLKTIERETVHANLLLFPIFSKRVYGLIRHFSSRTEGNI